jgi:uncharacterized membrane protein
VSPFGVNRWGQVAGEADNSTPDPAGEDYYCGFAYMGYPSGATCLPMVWQDGVMKSLPTLKDKNGQRGNNGTANGINAWGETTGVSENTTADTTCPPYELSLGQSQHFQQKPVDWQDGHVQELPTVGGDPDGTALAINDLGHSVGTSGVCSAFNNVTFLNIQPVYAVLWENGRAIDLGSLGGVTNNLALAVDNNDDVVGFSDVSGDATFHGFLWTKETGKMYDLAPISGDVFSVGLAVSNGGEITGVSLDADFNPRAVLWHPGVSTDLNALIPSSSSLYLMTGCSVNDSGQIIGLAFDSNLAAQGPLVFHGYLLTPGSDAHHGDDLSPTKASGPLQLPESVREQLRRQSGLGRFMPHHSLE